MANIRKEIIRDSEVTLKAMPKSGKRFDHWYSQLGTPFNGGTSPMSTENPVTFRMSHRCRIQAFFDDDVIKSEYTLTVIKWNKTTNSEISRETVKIPAGNNIYNIGKPEGFVYDSYEDVDGIVQQDENTYTINKDVTLKVFYTQATNNSTSTLVLPERVDFSTLNVNGNSGDFTTFFKYYEPTPGYDVRDDLGGWGSMPAYSFKGRTTEKMVVHSKAKGIAYTPYFDKELRGYSRIEASFQPESEYSDIFHVKLTTKGNIYMGDVEESHGVYTSTLLLDTDLLRNTDENKYYLDNQNIVLYVLPKDGKSLAEKLTSIPHGTFIGGINMVLYYGGVSGYSTVAAGTYIHLYVGKPEDLEVGADEVLLDLKDLWKRPNGFYINDNLEVDPKSARY